MSKIKNILICISVCLFFSPLLSGQSFTNTYRTAIGLRAGETTGLILKFNTNNSSAIELIGGIWRDWFSITCLYEKRAPAFNVDGMKWYYGGGGHLSIETDTYYNPGKDYDRGNDFGIGIDGIVGLEYKIPEIPFAVSLDFKPLIEIDRGGDLYLAFDPGLGVKFTF